MRRPRHTVPGVPHRCTFRVMTAYTLCFLLRPLCTLHDISAVEPTVTLLNLFSHQSQLRLTLRNVGRAIHCSQNLH
ncbi:hypothetical protein BD414DRAFT_174623 [Trametes punicea]|nr:hypothetical protein BD414DRAFT_174623 [Trametes punicea]